MVDFALYGVATREVAAVIVSFWQQRPCCESLCATEIFGTRLSDRTSGRAGLDVVSRRDFAAMLRSVVAEEVRNYA